MTGSRQNPCRDPARHQQGFAVARRVFSGKTGRSGTGSQTGIKQGPGRNRSRLQRKASRSPSEGGPEASGKQARIGRKPLRAVPCCGSTSPKRRQAWISRKPANIGSGRVYRTRRNPPRNALSPTPPRGTRPGLWEPARNVFSPAPRQEEPIGDAWERDRRDRRSRAARRRRRALRPIGRSGAPLPPSARRPASHASPACGA